MLGSSYVYEVFLNYHRIDIATSFKRRFKFTKLSRS